MFKDKVLGYFVRKKRPQRCQSDNLVIWVSQNAFEWMNVMYLMNLRNNNTNKYSTDIQNALNGQHYHEFHFPTEKMYCDKKMNA